MCHLEARALWLIHIQGLQVRAPVIDQPVVVVVVLAGHLRGLVLMRLIHVNHLHSVFSKPQSCCGWGLVLMGLIYMNNLHVQQASVMLWMGACLDGVDLYEQPTCSASLSHAVDGGWS